MLSSLHERLSRGPLLSDGATGTQLYAHGLTTPPLEMANVDNPDVVKSLHLGYLEAGSELIETNTFGANASRLAAWGVASRVEEINRAGVALAQEAARLHGQQVWIAGAMGPLQPDTLSQDLLGSAAAHNVFAEQAAVLSDAGVDLILLETFTSLAQLRLAIGAVRSVSPLPVIAQLTFNGDALTPSGDSPEAAAAALSQYDLLTIGANCSVGPDLLRSVIERMAAVTDQPLGVQPNAGLPAYVHGRLQYAASAEYFAETAREMARAGAVLLGGCCGTTPEHIAAVRDAVRGVSPSRTHPAYVPPAVPVAAPRVTQPLQPTGLAERIERGEFIVTAELSPPRGFDISDTLDKLRSTAGHIHAVNVTDSPRAQGRMSALATGSLIQSKLGVETIMHMAIRHRNLLALHSDLLGAHALGLRNVFTMMGDVPLTGDYPQATAVSDVTPSGLIRLMAGFNRGVDANGHDLEQPTSFFIGAALNFNAPDLDNELRMLERKVQAGAHFLLTQPVYAPEDVDRVWSRLGGFPLPVIMGVLPLRSARHARFLHNEVPGIVVPDAVLQRIERADDGAAAEGIALSQELLTALAGHIAGAYFMPPFERFAVVQETLEGLTLPGLPQ